MNTSHQLLAELEATVRIDTRVWLELADGRRYLIADRGTPVGSAALELWRGFEGAKVIATGQCYTPAGTVTDALHFKVEHLKFASPPKRSVPLFEIGPEVVMAGAFVVTPYPAGSKLAGETQLDFRTADTSFHVVGSFTSLGPTPTASTITARVVEPNRAYAADSGDPQIWVVSTELAKVPASLELCR